MKNYTVNGRWYKGDDEEISYAKLSVMSYKKVIKGLTCGYSNPGHNSGGGSLVYGQRVKLLDGMHFNIISTNNA